MSPDGEAELAERFEPNLKFSFSRFKPAASVEEFVESALANGADDVIDRMFLKGYDMHFMGLENGPAIKRYAFNVGLYAPAISLKYEERVGNYMSDPKNADITYEIDEFEIVHIIEPLAKLDEIVGSGRSRDELVRKLTSEGIGVFDGGELVAGEELLYTAPLSQFSCDYSISFCYGGVEPPFPNGVVHAILPRGEGQHMGVQPASFDSDDDDWHGEWKPSEAISPRRAERRPVYR